jgi:hypothetical protein
MSANENNILTKLNERLDTIEKTLLRNTISLEEHVRRTALLEDEVKPMRRHIILVEGLIKASSVAIAAAVGLKHLGVL